MKTLFSAILLAALTGCAGPLAKVARIWPDGASVAVDEVTVNVSMSGAGSMVVKGVRWTGTNGFPIPGTNTVTMTTNVVKIVNQ